MIFIANLVIKDGTPSTKYVGAEGTGTDLDPFIVRRVLEGGYGRITKEITLGDVTTTHHALDCIAHTTADATTHNLPLAGRKVGGTGSIVSAALKTDNPLWATGISVIIYDTAPAAFIADHAAFDLMYADKGKVVCQLDISAFNKVTGGAGSAAWGRVEGMNRPFQCAVDSQNLYFQMYTTGVSTAQTSGQKFSLEVGIIRD